MRKGTWTVRVGAVRLHVRRATAVDTPGQEEKVRARRVLLALPLSPLSHFERTSSPTRCPRR
eukprot:746395-Hanusia_phi.AAC.2